MLKVFHSIHKIQLVEDQEAAVNGKESHLPEAYFSNKAVGN